MRFSFVSLVVTGGLSTFPCPKLAGITVNGSVSSAVKVGPNPFITRQRKCLFNIAHPMQRIFTSVPGGAVERVVGVVALKILVVAVGRIISLVKTAATVAVSVCLAGKCCLVQVIPL